MYTEEQIQKRNKSIWTKMMSTLAPLQFIAFVISFYLVCRYLITDTGYTAATVSVLVKIGLLWAMMDTRSPFSTPSSRIQFARRLARAFNSA